MIGEGNRKIEIVEGIVRGKARPSKERAFFMRFCEGLRREDFAARPQAASYPARSRSKHRTAIRAAISAEAVPNAGEQCEAEHREGRMSRHEQARCVFCDREHDSQPASFPRDGAWRLGALLFLRGLLHLAFKAMWKTRSPSEIVDPRRGEFAGSRAALEVAFPS